MPYNYFCLWPEFSFRNRSKAADYDTWTWEAHMTDGTRTWKNYKTETGYKGCHYERLVCSIQGKSGRWAIPAYDEGSPRDLGRFRTRREAVEAFLTATDYLPNTESLNAECANARWVNNLHPRDLRLFQDTANDTWDSEDMANAIWDILVFECGASESSPVSGRESFVAFLKGRPLGQLTEYRFQGAIGFGAKLYFEHNCFRVGCYSEERTPYVDLMIAEANARLNAFHARWGTR